ncbi:outer surface protein [Bacillus cereus]|uniref:Outer surface protein n=1 Tax=Bacillus cereus TaxID=1396 RepID=A0A2C1MQT7_BACCE|nr:outer surface protein [Bacillus cereus]PFQ43352.1 outer surface protein [Bacillus cereus]PGU12351.1 outer surface protein [Bacillus cereus]
MKITKGKVIGVIILSVLCIPFIIGKESKIKDFPVSIFSSYVEDDNPKDYKYTAFIPDFAIWINGWEYQRSEGEITSYKKGNRTVIVHYPPGNDSFYLYDVNDSREYTQP